MKRLFICLLAALLLTSCGTSSSTDKNTSKTPGTTTSGSSSDNGGESETVPEETEPSVDDLFKITAEDNNGAKFTILSTETHSYEYDAEEIVGEGVNDAIYERNATVENLLGIDLEFIFQRGDWGGRDSYCDIIRTSVMAQDGAYDVINGMISCVQPIAAPGLFMSVYDVPGIDLNNPWWVSELQDNLTINGKLLGFMGDMSLSMYKGLSVIFANLNLINQYAMENPYELVLNNKWTLDKMIEVSSGVGKDLDGDGTITLENDIFGMVAHGVTYRSMQSSLGLSVIGRGDDGKLVVNPITDNFASAAEKLNSYLGQNDVMFSDDQRDANFASDNIIYYMYKLECLDSLRDMESDYAILPFPKMDENQEKYLTQIATAAHMTYIPVTTNDPTLTGKVCEAMSYYSYKNVVPAYYDGALKTKYSRDPDTQKMLDIIRDGAIMPIDYAYSTVIAGSPWPNMLLHDASRNGNLASLHASSQNVWETGIRVVDEMFDD